MACRSRAAPRRTPRFSPRCRTAVSMSASGPAAAAGANVAVIVALGVERAAFGARAGRHMPSEILQSGPGAVRAAQAATAALAAGASGLVSFGLAGALRAELAPGAVLLPRRVRSATAAFDDLLSVPAALTTPSEKSAAAASGAVAADMESAAIAAVAARAGARFL